MPYSPFLWRCSSSRRYGCMMLNEGPSNEKCPMKPRNVVGGRESLSASGTPGSRCGGSNQSRLALRADLCQRLSAPGALCQRHRTRPQGILASKPVLCENALKVHPDFKLFLGSCCPPFYPLSWPLSSNHGTNHLFGTRPNMRSQDNDSATVSEAIE